MTLIVVEDKRVTGEPETDIRRRRSIVSAIGVRTWPTHTPDMGEGQCDIARGSLLDTRQAPKGDR